MNTTKKVVLQINSIEVLERLLGGDSEVEIDLRNNIVQAFTAKHLKSIAALYVDRWTAEEIKNSIGNLDEMFQLELQKYLKKNPWEGVENWKVGDKIKNDIRAEVSKTVEVKISAAIQDAIKSIEFTQLEALIKKRVIEGMQCEIARSITSDIGQLINKAMKDTTDKLTAQVSVNKEQRNIAVNTNEDQNRVHQ